MTDLLTSQSLCNAYAFFYDDVLTQYLLHAIIHWWSVSNMLIINFRNVGIVTGIHNFFSSDIVLLSDVLCDVYVFIFTFIL